MTFFTKLKSTVYTKQENADTYWGDETGIKMSVIMKEVMLLKDRLQ